MQATCKNCGDFYAAIPFQPVADWARNHAKSKKHVVNMSSQHTYTVPEPKKVVLAPHTDSGLEFIDISKKCVHMHSENEYSAEASDLELRCGNWPTMLCLLLPHKNGATGVQFFKGQAIWTGHGEDRDLGGYEYHSKNGVKLTVWND